MSPLGHTMGLETILTLIPVACRIELFDINGQSKLQAIDLMTLLFLTSAADLDDDSYRRHTKGVTASVVAKRLFPGQLWRSWPVVSSESLFPVALSKSRLI